MENYGINHHMILFLNVKLLIISMCVTTSPVALATTSLSMDICTAPHTSNSSSRPKDILMKDLDKMTFWIYTTHNTNILAETVLE